MCLGLNAGAKERTDRSMNEQKTNAAPETVSSYVVEAWKCPKCGANNRFNPNICTSCNYSKIPPVQVLPPQSRMVWEKISFILLGVMIALQLAYAVSIALGFGLTVLYGIGGIFLETALQCPDMLLYSHFVTAGVCAATCAISVVFLLRAIKNRDALTSALHTTSVVHLVSLWAFPVVNILTDMIVTSIKVDGKQLRPSGAYDAFDLGLNILVPIIISAVVLIIMYVNNRLAPSDDHEEEE